MKNKEEGIISVDWNWLNNYSEAVTALAAVARAVLTGLNNYSEAVTALAAVAGAMFAGLYTWITRRLVRVAIQQREIIAAQHKLQSAQVKYMLYEPRLKIFREVLHFIAIVNTSRDIEIEPRIKFSQSTAECAYIFGNDIQDYIHEISSKAGALHASITKYNTRFRDLPNSHKDRIACEEEMEKLQIWFSGKDYEATTKFAPYLKIED